MKKYWIAVSLVLASLLVQCLYFAWDNGQVVDETFYNGSGYPMVRYNDYRILGEHPPLMMQLGSLPLLLLKPKYPINNPTYLGDSKLIDVSVMGSRFLYEMGNNAQLILFLERIPIVLLTVLFGLVLLLWAKEIYGIGGAMLALILYSFSPNIIANGSQFTTDLGITAFFFMSVYRLKHFFELPSVRNAVLVGLCCGLALVSKISAFILFPVMLFLFLLFPLLDQQSLKRMEDETPLLNRWLLVLAFLLFFLSLGQKLVFVIIGPLCLTVINTVWLRKTVGKYPFLSLLGRLMVMIGYGICGIFIVLIAQKRQAIIAVAAALWTASMAVLNVYLSQKSQRRSLVYLAKIFVLIWFLAAGVVIFDYTDFYLSLASWNPFHHYVRTFNIASTHSISGHGGCVAGSFVTCDWKYFISAMTIKTPLATILLFAVGLVAMFWLNLSKVNKALLLIPPAIFFLIASSVNHIYIGVRHVLPVYPFVFIIAGGSLPAIMKIRMQVAKRAILTSLFILIGCFIWRNVRVTPHNLSYFNELVGNAEKGVNYLPVNAGQDNKRLADLVHRLKIPFIRIASSRNNPPEYDYYRLPWSYMNELDWQNPAPGYYAMDLEMYQSQQFDEKSWFRNRKPDYKAGKTIYVFKVAG